MSQTQINDREFAYRPRWSAIIGCGLLFGAGGVGFCYKAASNEGGLIINGVIELSPQSATAFFWVLACLFFAFLAVGVPMFVVRMLNPQKIVLSQDGIYAPKGFWSRHPKFIKYADIRSVSSYQIFGEHLLAIVHAGGKHTVGASMLKSRRVFGEFCQLLAQRMQEVCGPPAV